MFRIFIFTFNMVYYRIIIIIGKILFLNNGFQSCNNLLLALEANIYVSNVTNKFQAAVTHQVTIAAAFCGGYKE